MFKMLKFRASWGTEIQIKESIHKSVKITNKTNSSGHASENKYEKGCEADKI